MRRNMLTAAILALLLVAPGVGKAADSYSLVLAGSRCATAMSRADGVFASAWVCTGVQLARAGTQLPAVDVSQEPRTQNSFGCISIADFRKGVAQRACGPLADSSLTGDPALQQGKIDFFLVRGDDVLAARITFTGIGPYLNDHMLSEFGNAGSSPTHRAQFYAVARVYRTARLGGFIFGNGIGSAVGGTRGVMSTGVSGIATIETAA